MFEQKEGCAAATLPWSARITGLTKVLVGVMFLALLHDPASGLSASLSNPYSLDLGWDAAQNQEVVGYDLYYGTNSGKYTNNILTGNVTTATVTGLASGITYYFAITSVDAEGDESPFSSEISYQQESPGGAQLLVHSVAAGQFALTVSGTSGHTYDLAASPDLKVWAVIGTVTLDASGSLNFTDTNAFNFPQRFYRTQEQP